MTLIEFVGCSLVAFGPSLSMFVVTIANCPIRVIIFITAAFFWLVSLLISSVLWHIATAAISSSILQSSYLAFGVVEAVLFQELFRFGFYKILRKAEVGLKKVTEVGTDGSVVTDSRQTLAYVSGLGFGVMSGGFSLLNILADLTGPATVGLGSQPENFVLISSLTTCLFIFLNTFWGVLLFHAFDVQNKVMIFAVIFTHLTCSLLTLLNPEGIYLGSLLPILVLTIICGAMAFHYSGGRVQQLKTLFALPKRTCRVESPPIEAN